MDSPESVNILLIEDNPDDVAYVQQILTEEPGSPFHIESVVRLSDGLARLSKDGIDVVLLDLSLPDSRGVETLEKFHQQTQLIPVIILTGLDDDQACLKAIQDGAQDYIVKRGLDRALLSRAVFHAIERFRILEGLRQNRENLMRSVLREMQNPLTIILEALDGLRREAGPRRPLGSKQTEYLAMAHRNAVLLRTLAHSLRDVCRFESGTVRLLRRPLDIEPVIRECRSRVQSELLRREIEMDIFIATGLPEVFADPALLSDVLMRLLGNALRFARERITIRAVEDASGVEIAVIDDGPGIPEEQIKSIFSQSPRIPEASVGREMGTGFGLSICKAAIDLHGGKIWAESTYGYGAAFHMTLPRHDDMEQFLSTFDQCLRRAAVHGKPLTVFAVCLSNLVDIQIRAGPESVERIYRDIEERVGSVIRTSDAILRFRNDVLILAEAGRPERLLIRNRMQIRLTGCGCGANGGRIQAVCRIGMATHGEESSSPKELLGIALKSSRVF